MRPRSIVIVGASDNPDKIGGRPISYMKQYGYRGALYAVNPGRTAVQGLVSFPDVASLPETPDMALICVPDQAAVDAVQTCAARGVKVAVIVSSGFAETGESGRKAQQQMRLIARAAGMRLVGPNTQGLANFNTGAIASFATLIGEISPADGAVAVVSQSGAMSALPCAFLQAEGIGVRYSLATGNEVDLTVADFVMAAVLDHEIKLVVVYVESLTKPETLAAAAALARARDVPIIVLRSGTSAAGQAAASSHTGALATEDRLLQAFFEQNGILRVPSMRSLVLAVRLLLAPIRPNGNRVVAISNSGASCVMAADAADRHGLQLPTLSAAVTAELRRVLPSFASHQNPVDLTAALLTNNRLFGSVLPIVASSGEVDMAFISLPMSGKGYDAATFAADAARVMNDLCMPIVLACPLAKTREAFELAGIVSFAHDEDAMEALGQLAGLQRLNQDAARLGRDLMTRQPATHDQDDMRSGIFLSEYDSLRLLRELGIPVVKHCLCANGAELETALTAVERPWAIKACSAAIPHKTEHGLVRLGVTDKQTAVGTFDAFMTKGQSMGIPLDGVIIAEMLGVEREMIVGARWDAQFGPIVVIGDGGKYVEAMPDSIVLLYPFDEAYALRRMRTLRMAPLFDGVRGEASLPIHAVARIAIVLGKWVAEQNGHVKSVDINPLLLAKEGRFAAADALVELSAHDQENHDIQVELQGQLQGQFQGHRSRKEKGGSQQ